MAEIKKQLTPPPMEFKSNRAEPQAKIMLSPQDFLAIIEISFEGVIITGKDGIILYVNPAWEKATGWSAGEVVGKTTPRILKSGKQPQSFYEEMWKTIASGKLFRAEITNKRKDGSLYISEAAIFPVRSVEGETLYIEVSRDITAQREAESRLEKIQKEQTERLTQKVSEKTRDLNEKIAELEMINKLMVGR